MRMRIRQCVETVAIHAQTINDSISKSFLQFCSILFVEIQFEGLRLTLNSGRLISEVVLRVASKRHRLDLSLCFHT
jgi:hypothetical protein